MGVLVCVDLYEATPFGGNKNIPANKEKNNIEFFIMVSPHNS